MAVKIGDVTIRIGASTKQLEADLRKAERSLQATADKFTNIGQNLTLGVTAPVLAAGAAAFKMASDYEESLNKVRVAFGGSSESVEQFAKTAIDSIGLAEQSALDMAALFGDMATSMGLTQPAAAQMSTSLVQLAGDLASFKNINIEEATTALAGVFTGETESLKRLGVVMTEANVQAYALEKGIKKKLNTMSQAEKVSLRYQYVLDKTKNAQGDFARTSDGAANQMRTLQQSVKDLGAGFGKELLPIITPLIQKLVEAVKSFSSLDNATKKTIITVAGLAAALGPAIAAYGQLTKAYGAVQVGATRIIATWIEQSAKAAEAAGAIPQLTANTVALGTKIRATLTFLAPYAAAIGLVAVGIYALYESYKDANNQIDKNAELTKKASDAIASEQAQTQSLIAVIRDENKSKKEKEGALRKLQDIAPEYFKNLSIEKSSIKDINAAYASYNASIERSIKAKIGKEDLESQIKDERRLVQSIKDRQKSIEELSKKTPKTATGSIREGGGAEQISQINKLKDLYSDQSAELKQLKSIQQLKDETLKFINANEDLISSVNEVSGKSGGGGVNEFTNQIKKLDEELRNNQKLLNAGLISSSQAAENEIALLQKKLETLVLSGLSPTSTAVVAVKDRINELSVVSFKFSNDLSNIVDKTDNLALEFLKLENSFDIGLINQSELSSQKIALLSKELQTLSDQGFSSTSSEVIRLKEEIAVLTNQQNDLITKTQTYLQIIGLLPGKYNVISGSIKTLSDAQKKQLEELNSFNEGVKNNIQTSLGSLFETVSEGLGAAFTGAGNFKSFLGTILTVVSDFAKSFGKQLVAIGVAKLSLDKLFKSIGGAPIAIAAGIALIALAGAITSNLAKNTPSLAIGTDLVKSDGLAMIHKGEAIVPANVAKGGYTGAGGGNQIYGRLSGIDLLLSNEYAKSYHSRLR